MKNANMARPAIVALVAAITFSLFMFAIMITTPNDKPLAYSLRDEQVIALIDEYVDNEYRMQTLDSESANLAKYLYNKNSIIAFDICYTLDGYDRTQIATEIVLFLGAFDIDCETILRG